jgi:hypothetical protein
MRNLLCALALGLALGGAASAADQIQCLPPLHELVEARLKLLGARQLIERNKEVIALESNRWYNKFLVDRLSGTGNYGKGFTVDSSLDGTTDRKIVETNNSSSAWTISYTLPLSALFDKPDTDKSLLEEKQKLEKRDEATKINLQYGELLEAKRKLIAFCSTIADEKCLPLVFLIRKAAVSLLCATGLKATGNDSDWIGVAKEYAADLKDLSCKGPD